MFLLIISLFFFCLANMNVANFLFNIDLSIKIVLYLRIQNKYAFEHVK